MPMPVISVKFPEANEPMWEDLPGRLDDIVHLTGPINVGVLMGGMASGLPNVVIRIDLPDGKVLLQETSVNALKMALVAITGGVEARTTPTPDGTKH